MEIQRINNNRFGDKVIKLLIKKQLLEDGAKITIQDHNSNNRLHGDLLIITMIPPNLIIIGVQLLKVILVGELQMPMIIKIKALLMVVIVKVGVVITKIMIEEVEEEDAEVEIEEVVELALK